LKAATGREVGVGEELLSSVPVLEQNDGEPSLPSEVSIRVGSPVG